MKIYFVFTVLEIFIFQFRSPWTTLSEEYALKKIQFKRLE